MKFRNSIFEEVIWGFKESLNKYLSKFWSWEVWKFLENVQEFNENEKEISKKIISSLNFKKIFENIWGNVENALYKIW